MTTIQKQFNKVISYSQGIPDPQTDELFDTWLKEKEKFISAWDNNFIYTYPEEVNFELDKEEKEKLLEEFIFKFEFTNTDLHRFLQAQKEGFFNNRVVKDYPYKDAIITKGTKLLRAFKYFYKDKSLLEAAQNEASMIIQKDKVSGTLCLSVHPLDFLSSSENTHGWRSCHALDGEYRAGNLSYMVDHCTIMCYLKSKEDAILPNFPEDVKWNNKKWRVLLYFSEDRRLLIAGRQYPFTSKTGIDFVLHKVLPAARLGHWGNWNKTKVSKWAAEGAQFHLDDRYIPIEYSLVGFKQIIHDQKGSLMFDDLLHSSCYDPIYAYQDYYLHDPCYPAGVVTKTNTSIEHTLIKMGGKTKCCHCGTNYMDWTETMRCSACELEYGTEDNDEIATCPCCGERFYRDDGYFINGEDDFVCASCAYEYAKVCHNCNEMHYREDMIYDEDREEWYCIDCYNSIKEE